MAWGILEDHKTPSPPGTVLIDDVKQAAMAARTMDTTRDEFRHLKKDKHVILQPQPSDSVNDPLNWPLKRKMAIIFTLICTGVAVGGMMSMLGTAARQIADRYHVSYPVFIQTLNPPGIAANAIALFLACAIAAVWGKRIGIVIGAFVMWINMLCGYFANSLIYYRNLNIVNGIFAAPGELLLGPIVTDIIFIHQRGRLMALSAIVGVIGGDASHVIAGNIIAKLGVKYLYIISFAIMTPFLVAIYWFVWETTYVRAPPLQLPKNFERKDSEETVTPSGMSETTANQLPDDLKKTRIETIEDTSELSSTPSISSFHPPTESNSSDPKYTLAQNLRIYRGRVTNRSFFKSLLQPFPFMVFPSVLFSTIINGAFGSWGHISGMISHQVLLYPPYNLQPDKLAYISLPGSAVSLVFAIVSGLSSDKLIQWLAHRNNGIYEPEFRLLLMIPAVIFSTIGFSLLGPLYQQQASVFKLVLASLLFHISGPFASSACVTYIFDTMQKSTTEAFVATSLFKHLFSFLVSTYVPKWYAAVGPVTVFRTLVFLNLATAAAAIPMYMFGKRLRGAVSRSKFLANAADVAAGYGGKP